MLRTRSRLCLRLVLGLSSATEFIVPGHGSSTCSMAMSVELTRLRARSHTNLAAVKSQLRELVLTLSVAARELIWEII